MFLRNMKKKITTLQVKQKEELKRARDDADVENLSTGQYEKIQTVLIIDEIQLIYKNGKQNQADVSKKYAGSAADFWDTIKLCFQGINLYVCCIWIQSQFCRTFEPYPYTINERLFYLKITLLTRSQMSSVLQAIVKNLLPTNYCIPELSLVMNGKKPKGSVIQCFYSK
ncbi:hypothetical protein GLOIN_2v1764418 [Rhizophagus irregularis DAOM 181602=DAOM 197198]|nr:hypothetical protein GLOIN_2v1764418 [Rhizophagus irregularis DAOM 181602=DAOM 197198]